MSDKVIEFRGVKNVYAAEILCDDNENGAGHGYVTDTPFKVAGASTLTIEVDNSSDTHFYDNYGAIVITAEGATTVTVEMSALELANYAKITGYQYNQYTGAVIEGKRDVKYFALLFEYEDTDGDEYFGAMYKGMFAVPSSSYVTMNNSTDANGQTVVFTAIRTNHKFTNAQNDGAKSMKVNGSENKVNTSGWFTGVVTPDNITQITAYELSKTTGMNTVLTIKRNGVILNDGEAIYAGDQLKITVANGTVTVNSNNFISGDIHVVSGDTAVVSTYSA